MNHSVKTGAAGVVSILLLAGVASGQEVLISSVSGTPARVQLDWMSVPEQTYSVYAADSLAPVSWSNATPDGIVASNLFGAYETTVTNRSKFFTIVKEDTDPPSVVSLLPADDAIAVVSNATVSIELSDETGVDTNSIVAAIGQETGLSVSGGQLIWSSNVVEYTPSGALGDPGSLVTNQLTVSDTLGNTASNYTWAFQLARPPVATNAFVSLTAPPEPSGASIMSDGRRIQRRLSTVHPMAETEEFQIQTATSNSVVFSYETAPPELTNGTLLVSYDAAYPFYRRTLSNEVNEAQQEVTVWTTNVPLTELLSGGSMSPLDLTPATQGASVDAELNLLQVEFGEPLDDAVIFSNTLAEARLASPTWSFVGNVDVSFDVAQAQLQSLDATATGTLSIEMTPEVIFRAAVENKHQYSLAPPAVQWFGGVIPGTPIPVWVEVIMELNAGVEYSAAAAAEASTTISAKNELTFRVYLRDNVWDYGFDEPVLVLEAEPISWQVEGTANAVVYVQPKLTVLAYSLAGLWADVKPYGELDGWFQANPAAYELGLYFGVVSTLGIESRIWYEGWGPEPPKRDLFHIREQAWSDSYPSDVPPVFLQGFPDRTVTEGSRLKLTGRASGTPQPGYAWFRDGRLLRGENGPEYLIASANDGYEGTYKVRAHNSAGSVETSCVVNVTSGGTGGAPDDMVYVAPGTAAGGSPTITEAFYIDTYEVTNEKMREVMQWAYDEGGLITASGSTVRNAQGNQHELLDLDDVHCQISFSGGTFSVDSGKGNYPCVEVTWYGAAAYCNYLSLKEGRTVAYDLSDWSLDTGASGYRLPSEAQWEYAARGGKDGNDTEYSGSDTISDVAWYWENSDAPGNSGFYSGKGTLPVGGKMPNELGTCDMSGNVWEWCHDWSGSRRVLRGGSWDYHAYYCRVALRRSNYPASSINLLGFRVVLPPGQ